MSASTEQELEKLARNARPICLQCATNFKIDKNKLILRCDELMPGCHPIRFKLGLCLQPQHEQCSFCKGKTIGGLYLGPEK